MNRISHKQLLWLPVLWLAACVRTEIIPEVLEPKLVLDARTVALNVGESRQLPATYMDEMNADRSDLIRWESTDSTIATVSLTGLATGKAPGQAWAMATVPDNLIDSVLLTVIEDDNNAVARVTIQNAPSYLTIGSSVQLQAKVYNAANQELNGQQVSWSGSNAGVFQVSASGVVTGLSAGAGAVTASSAGISSLPVTIQVQPAGGLARSGQFSGNSGYSVSGTATLQQDGDNLALTLGSDFSSGNGPMLGVFLAKTAAGGLSSQNSLKLGDLQKNTGMQVYSVPAGVKLNDYDYVVIYCIPFNVRFGTAKLN